METVTIKTGRFGEITVKTEDRITFPQGLLGFPDLKEYCLVDSGDDTLILWLQSVTHPDIAFPVLEPRVFKSNYLVKLSGAELKDLRLTQLNEASVFNVLTIPEDVREMSANLKAPLVVHLKERIGRQVVLQEVEYPIKHPMFKELRAHLMTLESARGGAAAQYAQGSEVLPLNNLVPSEFIRSLQA